MDQRTASPPIGVATRRRQPRCPNRPVAAGSHIIPGLVIGGGALPQIPHPGWVGASQLAAPGGAQATAITSGTTSGQRSPSAASISGSRSAGRQSRRLAKAT